MQSLYISKHLGRVSHPNLNRKSTKVIQDYNDEAMFGMISPTYH